MWVAWNWGKSSGTHSLAINLSRSTLESVDIMSAGSVALTFRQSITSTYTSFAAKFNYGSDACRRYFVFLLIICARSNGSLKPRSTELVEYFSKPLLIRTPLIGRSARE